MIADASAASLARDPVGGRRVVRRVLPRLLPPSRGLVLAHDPLLPAVSSASRGSSTWATPSCATGGATCGCGRQRLRVAVGHRVTAAGPGEHRHVVGLVAEGHDVAGVDTGLVRQLRQRRGLADADRADLQQPVRGVGVGGLGVARRPPRGPAPASRRRHRPRPAAAPSPPPADGPPRPRAAPPAGPPRARRWRCPSGSRSPARGRSRPWSRAPPARPASGRAARRPPAAPCRSRPCAPARPLRWRRRGAARRWRTARHRPGRARRARARSTAAGGR